jgi:prepilin-type processing-associated H-X9-DG protein
MESSVGNPVLEYARPSSLWQFTRLNLVALLCASALIPFYLLMPRIFSTFRGPHRYEWALFIIFTYGLPASLPVLLGLLSLRQRRRYLTGGGWLAWVAIVAGTINFFAVPAFQQFATDRASRDYGISHGITRCGSNLRQIGQAILMYANENHGNFPASFQQLIETQEIASSVFICDFSNDTMANGPTTQAIAFNLMSGGHLSYEYAGKGMSTSTVPPDTVIAYDRPGNHAAVNLDVHVLFGDGHVERVSPDTLAHIISELGAGHNPPRANIRAKP